MTSKCRLSSSDTEEPKTDLFSLLSISFPKYSDEQAFYQLIFIINKDINIPFLIPNEKGERKYI